MLFSALATMSFLLAFGEDEPVAQAWSAAFRVDSRGAVDRFARVDDAIAYSPSYSSWAADESAYVIVRKVKHPDTVQAVTSVLERCEAGVSGDIAFSLGADDARTFRLLHTAYDASGRQIGETLVSDVGVAYTKTSSAVTIDTRADSLQRVAEAGGPAPLAYSTDWCTNGTPASVVMTCVCDRYHRGQLVEPGATSEIFAAVAPAAGDHSHEIVPGVGGTFTLTCSFLDAVGEPLQEPLTASYRFKEQWGMLLFIK